MSSVAPTSPGGTFYSHCTNDLSSCDACCDTCIENGDEKSCRSTNDFLHIQPNLRDGTVTEIKCYNCWKKNRTCSYKENSEMLDHYGMVTTTSHTLSAPNPLANKRQDGDELEGRQLKGENQEPKGRIQQSGNHIQHQWSYRSLSRQWKYGYPSLLPLFGFLNSGE